MAKIVEITQASSITCEAGGNTSAEFSVTNITGRDIRVGIRVMLDDAGAEAWFEPQGGPEWKFSPAENKPVSVNIKVPADAPESKKMFGIEVFSAEPGQGGIDFTTSEKMVLEVTQADTPEPGPKWPWFALAAAVLVVIGGVAAWLLSGGVPDVVGEPYEVAVSSLKDEGYSNIRKKIAADAKGEPGVVIDQSTGDKGDDDKPEIILSVPGVTLPEMKDLALQDLVDRLIELNLGTKLIYQTDNSKTPNTVIAHTPKAGAVVEKGSVVNVTISKTGRTPPKVPVWFTGQIGKEINTKALILLQKRARELQRDQ